MTNVDMPIVLPWIAFALAWLALGGLTLGIHRIIAQPLRRVAAAQRSVLLLSLALLPLAGALLVAMLGFAPRVGGLAVGPHCHAGSGCAPHVPMLHASLLEGIVLGATIAWISIGIVWRLAARLKRSIELANTLDAFATRVEDGDFGVIDSREPFAYCLGLWRPRLIVSRALLTELPDAERSAVLAHERAHVMRRDNLRQWLAALSLWPLPKRWHRALLDDLATANEQSCDAAAAAEAGLPSVVAAMRTMSRHDESAAERVAALTAPIADWPPTATLAAIVVLYTACALPTLDAVHFGTELVARWLG